MHAKHFQDRLWSVLSAEILYKAAWQSVVGDVGTSGLRLRKVQETGDEGEDCHQSQCKTNSEHDPR